jgi:hypothetical protein
MMRAPLPRKAPATKPAPAPTVPAEHRPAVSPFSPDPADRQWADDSFRGVFDAPPAPPFWDQVSAVARDFRECGDDLSRFVGHELDRLVAIASLIGAEGPADFDAKRDEAEATARGAWEARGYEAGYAEGQADSVGYSGPLD